MKLLIRFAHFLWVFGLFAAGSPSFAQSKGGAQIIVEDGQDESWNYWAVRRPGVDTWNREFTAAYRKKDYQKAIALSDKVIAQHVRGVAEVYAYRGIAKEKLKQYDAAKSDLKTALAKGRAENMTREFYAFC